MNQSLTDLSISPYNKPNPNAKIALSSPAGYDTILGIVDLSDQLESADLREDLLEHLHSEVRVASIDKYGKRKLFLRNLTFNLYRDKISLTKGSLARFYREGLYNYPLHPFELHNALRKLQSFIPVDWSILKLIRVDFTQDVPVRNNPNDFLSRCMSKPRWFQSSSQYTQKVWSSTKTTRNAKQELTFYNKSEESKLENDLLRLELRLKGYLRTNKLKVKLKFIEDLMDSNTYVFLINKLQEDYKSVRKQRFVNSKLNVTGTPTEFKHSLMYYAIHDLGDKLDKQLQEAKSKNDAYIVSRMRAFCNNVTSTQAPRFEDFDIVDEVNKSVFNYFEDSKQFIDGVDVPRFRDWVSYLEDRGAM